MAILAMTVHGTPAPERAGCPRSLPLHPFHLSLDAPLRKHGRHEWVRMSPLTPARRGDTIKQAQSEIFGTTRIRNEKTGIP
jgi:hypothetical protein